MNKDGGLSFFDVASNKVTEVLDNTTFVSIACQFLSCSPDKIRTRVKQSRGIMDHIPHSKYHGCLHTKKKANSSKILLLMPSTKEYIVAINFNNFQQELVQYYSSIHSLLKLLMLT